MDIEATIRNYLPQVIHMSLATSRENRPWVCEVHFACDESLNIYFRSLASRRHSLEIASNPHVAGNIVTQHHLNQKVRGIYFEGTARQIDSRADVKTAYQALATRLHLGPEILEEASQPDGGKFYQIKVGDFYVFDSYDASPGKHHLKWRH